MRAIKWKMVARGETFGVFTIGISVRYVRYEMQFLGIITVQILKVIFIEGD